MKASQNKTLRPNIFIYDDYRPFLSDMHCYLKAQAPSKFTFRTISLAAGFRSPSFLKHVMDGDRNLTQSSIYALSRALELNKKESKFFEKLVLFNQATSLDEKMERAHALTKSREYKRHYPLSQAQVNYYSKWYYVVIREMVSLKNFKNDPFWIAQSLVPQISENEVKRALKELEELELIIKTTSGSYQQSTPQVKTTPQQIEKAVAKNFHKQMLRRAAEALDIFESKDRQYSALTLAVSKDHYERIKREIDRLTDYILSLANESKDTDEIIQFNCQVFPVVNPKRFPEGDE